MTKAARWRTWSSLALLVVSALMVWPTVRWYSMPPEERDRAEAAVQPETDNPHLRSILDELQEEGGEELIEEYRQVYQRSMGTISLGLDLQGGMYLAYTVSPMPGLDAEEAIDQSLEVIRNRIDEFGVSEPSITKQGDDRIVIQLPGVRDPERARSIVERQALLEFKLVAYPSDEHPTPASVPVVRTVDGLVSPEAAPPPLEDGMQADSANDADTASAELPALSGTADPDAGEELPVPEPVDMTPDEGVSLEPAPGQASDLPEVAMPEPEATGDLSAIIGVASQEQAMSSVSVATGDWYVRIGDDYDRLNDILNRADVDSVLQRANLTFAFGRVEEDDQGEYRPVYMLPRDMTRGWGRRSDEQHPEYFLTGASLTDVTIRMGGGQSISNAPYLILEFDSDGARNWEAITGENVDEKVAIVLDGTVYSSAVIQERISGGGTRLSGGFSVEEARDLRLILKAGSLPAELEIAEEQTIGPSLGQRSIDRGMLAGVIALLFMAAFIILYYGTGGVVAMLALLFDMLIILGVLCFPGPLAQAGVAGLNATLTLPGIAGIILTIGMAIDASVLIYERIREESRAGKGMKAAVKAGYSRAFVTILDANLTTLITALVLYRFGTGPIRGFAVTLSIGILASMFCSLVFSRAVIELVLKARKGRLSLGRFNLLRDRHIAFVGMRKKTYVISAAAILLGAVAFFAHGGLNLSIDFTGGLETNVIAYEEMASADLRASLQESGMEDVQVQRLLDYEGEGAGAFVVRTSETDKGLVYSALEEAGTVPMELEEDEEGLSFIKQIGPRVGEELKSKAISAILISMVFIILYIWYRFQFKWGVAAVAAIVHDTLITLGFLALVRMDVSLTIIAALLTIVGYSINDTIVVFDRIREDRRLRKGKTLGETVDISINEVLSRTVITSMTTFVAVLILFVISIGVLSEFALTLMVGIIVGTYSSIFIASPILVDWHARLKRKK